MKRSCLYTAVVLTLLSCSSPVRLSVVDPGHFHATLVQKYELPGVDSLVRVYAPEGPELQAYMTTIDAFNNRAESPTNWKEEVIPGPPLENLPEAEGTAAVVLAGNNALKTAYILDAVRKGYNVLSDKPMAISGEDVALLEEAYRTADEKGLVIQELMTERTVAGNIALREWFSSHPIDTGTAEDPAIQIKSVHHFYKEVDGKALHRPLWYYDIRCQGEGIADVTTHYIDMIFTQCFPGQTIRPEDVEVLSASHYPTLITPAQFALSTGEEAFPPQLSPYIRDGVLEVMANGSILFCVKGVYARIEVVWDFEGKDSFEAIYKGFEGTFPADTLSHEDHFRLVMEDFLSYIRKEKKMPGNESSNTLTKYRLLQEAVRMAGE